MGNIQDLVEDVEEFAGSPCPQGKIHEGHCRQCWENTVAGMLQLIHRDLMEDADASDWDIQNFVQANPVTATQYFYPANPPAGSTMQSTGFPTDFRLKLLSLGIDVNAILKVEIINPSILIPKVIFNQFVNSSPVILPNLSQRVSRYSQFRITATFSAGAPTLLSASFDLRRLPASDRNLFRIEVP